MNATNMPTFDRSPRHQYAEPEMLAAASILTEEAIRFPTVVRRTGPLVAANPETASGVGLIQRFFAQLDEREQPIVRLLMRSSQYPIANAFGSAMNWLGNGWLYLVAVVALFMWQGDNGIRAALAGGCAVGIAFVFYLALKPILARVRPRDSDPLARLAIEPLDKYSCPSGHSMTASAVALPLVLAFPQLQPIVFSLVLLIAWSRIACGHHYPSDVLVGLLLGMAVAMPICSLIL